MKNNTLLIVDIETGPAPDADKFKPEFEASGNLKDPAKIAAALAEKEAEWRGKLALSPLTGQVLVVGCLRNKADFDIIEGDEAQVIQRAFKAIDEHICGGGYVVGHNLLGFDLPFLKRRAMKLGVVAPGTLRLKNYRYWDDSLVDTMQVWSQGIFNERVSLDNLSKFLGHGEKQRSGADFAELYRTSKADAIDYMEHDLKLTMSCARSLLT